MGTIDPAVFDVIVAGSGLVECLVGCALTKAGKSVLLLDPTDVYGSGFASFTLAGLAGSTDPEVNPNLARTAAAGEHSSNVDLSAMQQVPIPQPDLPISGVESWERPGAGAGIGSERSYILDLAPKVGTKS